MAILAALLSQFAIAAESGWYGGASGGQSGARIDDEKITGGLQRNGFSSVNITDDDSDVGYKIFGGYQFNKYFALESGYFNLGRFGYTSTTVPNGTLNGSVKIQGINLDAVGILPVSDRFAVFGRAGVNYAKTRDTFSTSGAVQANSPNSSTHDTNYKLGVGLQYAFTEALNMRVEAERYRINDGIGNKGDVDLLSVGLIYRFNASKPASAYAVAEPERIVPQTPDPQPIVVTPAPAPVKAAVVMPPQVTKRVTFQADSFFEFDKAIIRPEGKKAIDQFSSELRGSQYEVIRITGHTDRIGPHAYNLELSFRRAEAVKAYLMESAAIPGSQIEAKGTNGSDPLTKPGECTEKKPAKGKHVSKQLIACLQRDRRVDIDVLATQTSR